MTEAIAKLLKRFDHTKTIDDEEFLRDYGDARFVRFMLYLLAHHNQARDWDEQGYRLGFEGSQALADFRPQWHHIFPKKFLQDKYDDDQINALANIAVIGSSINIRISAQNPMNYLKRYKISSEKLEQQYIPTDIEQFMVQNFQSFLKNRSAALAEKANAYLASLSHGIENNKSSKK